MSRIKEQEIVTAFSKAMMQKLDKRSDKGRLGWRKKNIEDLFAWLTDEVNELRIELEEGPEGDTWDNVKWETVDVALLAMMIWDKIDLSKDKGNDL